MGLLPESRALRAKMRITSARMLEAFERLWGDERLAERFPPFLVMLHQIMRASVPLMEAARLRAEALAAAGDPVGPGLARYYAAHIPEERNHDAWVLEDLEALGLSRSDVLARVPTPAMASLAGAQYYWIHHHHPAALLGYIAVLEGYPPAPAHLERLARATGLAEEAFRTYRLHGEVDGAHTRDLDRILDDLPWVPAQRALIGLSAGHTAHLVAECLDEILAGELPERKGTDAHPPSR